MKFHDMISLAFLLLAPTLAFQQSTFVGRSLRHSFAQTNAKKSSSGGRNTQLCMKTIAVIGASGLTASECVYQALKNGDNVVGLTRYV